MHWAVNNWSGTKGDVSKDHHCTASYSSLKVPALIWSHCVSFGDQWDDVDLVMQTFHELDVQWFQPTRVQGPKLSLLCFLPLIPRGCHTPSDVVYIFLEVEIFQHRHMVCIHSTFDCLFTIQFTRSLIRTLYKEWVEVWWVRFSKQVCLFKCYRHGSFPTQF